MYPIGTKVIIRSVEHLSRSSRWLLNRTGVVTFHDDGMHEVAVRLGGRVPIGPLRWMFDTEHLEPATGQGA